ncbi:hypothetical protein [Arsenophonus endosymbiont of Bemisia tabaci]
MGSASPVSLNVSNDQYLMINCLLIQKPSS